MSSATRILLHGWGMHGSVFNSLLDALADGEDCYCPALPGYADSPWRFQPDFESQLALMGDDLPAGRLLGWSMGGLYAIELALRYPQKFSEVVLVACNPCFVARPDWHCGVKVEVLDAFQTDLENDWRRTLRRFLALLMQGEADARRLARDLWQQLAEADEPDLEVLRFGLALLRNHDARDSLGRLEQRVKLIVGDRDQLVPTSLCQQITDVARRIEVESLAGASHAPFLSDPIMVAARLKSLV